MAHVLITGGAGFVGLNIAEALLRAGFEVTILDRAAPPEAALRQLQAISRGLVFQEGDVTDDAMIDSLFCEARYDFAVIGAAITADLARERHAARAILETNLLGAIAILEAASRHRCRRVVYLSSASVYGENANRDPLLDEAATPALPDSLYAISKFAGERAALRYRSSRGLDAVALRLSAVFGPYERDTGVRDTLSPIYQVTEAALNGQEIVLARDSLRDWIYGPDVGNAVTVLLAGSSPLPFALYNVGPGESWGLAAWCEGLATRLPGARWRLGTPATVDLHGTGDRNVMSAARLRDGLGWRPQYDMEAALDDYLERLSRQGGGSA